VPFENASTAQTLLTEGSLQHFKRLRTISSEFHTQRDAHPLILLFRHPALHEQ
jgi:hypothetical protein